MKNIYILFLALFFSHSSFAIGPITGTDSLCVGAATILSDATSGGIWSSSNTAIANIGSANGIVTGVTAGTITISYTVSGSGTATATVTVNPVPATITGTYGFCNTAFSDILSDATPGGVWSCSYNAYDTITAYGILHHRGTCPGMCGVIDTVTYTLPTGCSVDFLVNSNPITVAYIPPTDCIGSPAFANGTPSGGVWSSSNTSVANITPSGSIYGISAGSASFTYTLFGCTLFGAPTSVTYGIAGHQVINNPDTLCNGPDFHIDACSASTSYNVTTWYGDGTSNNTPFTSGASSIDIFHTYTFPGTYHVKQVMYDGITAKDSISFSYEYAYCRTLPIKIYNDNNNDCIFGAGDGYSYLPSLIEIDSNGIVVDTMSGTSGIYYQAFGPPGTVYSFRVVSTPPGMVITCPATGILHDTISSYVNTYSPKYFGMQCTTASGFDLSEYVSMICGRHAVNCNILVDNTYCTTVSPVLTMNFSPKYIFSSAYPMPASVVGNTVTWNIASAFSYSSLPPSINVQLTVPGTWLTPGDTINSNFTVTPLTGDVNPANNYSVRVDTVKTSYDPNEMSVMPGGYISSGANLQYTINFENTGNDTAHNIYVMDTLSDNVDIHSLKILAASSVMNLAIFNIGGHNIVKFDFPGIMLPDSSHHNQCDGLVVFNINTLNGLSNGTSIFNHAGIFFDDNPVVMTDTVEDIINIPAGIATNSSYRPVEIYPNPTSGNLNIQWQNQLTGSADVIITDVLGREVYTSTINMNASSGQTQIGLQGLKDGIYLLTIKNSSIYSCKKFVVQH